MVLVPRAPARLAAGVKVARGDGSNAVVRVNEH